MVRESLDRNRLRRSAGAVPDSTSRSTECCSNWVCGPPRWRPSCPCGLIGQAVLAGPAGAVTVVKSELKNGQLRREGQSSPGVFVIAESTTSVGRSPGGSHRALQDPGRAISPRRTARSRIPDGGRTPTATVTLEGCTPSVTPVPPTPAPPTGNCIIIPSRPVTRRRRESRPPSTSTPPVATPRSTAAPPPLRCNGRSLRAAFPPG